MNGVGGNTVTAAQLCMPYAEFLSWLAYRRKRGSFNVGMRIEESFGFFSAMYANSKTKNGGFTRWDFMAHDEPPPVSLDQAKEDWT